MKLTKYESKVQNIIDLMKGGKYLDCIFTSTDDVASSLSLENILEKNNIVDKFRSLFNSKDYHEALEKLNDFKILSTTNQGEFGVEEINRQIEILLKKEKIIKVNNFNDTNYDFKPIMILSNDYNLKLYNGDTGIIFKGKAYS